MTTIKMGVLTIITRSIPMTESSLYKKTWITLGMMSSMAKISDENLFSIRPMGVVSKNDIGH